MNPQIILSKFRREIYFYDNYKDRVSAGLKTSMDVSFTLVTVYV
jgi:hypothetical protein